MVRTNRPTRCPTLLLAVELKPTVLRKIPQVISKLIHEMSSVLGLMPPQHSRYQMLMRLSEAFRLDVRTVHHHPTTLFQCLWNRCWWHDCSELADHLNNTFSETLMRRAFVLRRRMLVKLGVEQSLPELHTLLECWRLKKGQLTPGFRWLRSLRPPATSLDGHVNQMPGYGRCVDLVDVSPDGSRVVVASNEYWIGVWSGSTGIMLATLFLHIRGVTNVKFAPDGTWFAGLSYYGREMIAWDTASLREIRKPEAELSQLLFDRSRRPSRYAVQPDDTGAVILNDVGVTLASLPEQASWNSDLSGRIWAALMGSNVSVFRLEGDL